MTEFVTDTTAGVTEPVQPAPNGQTADGVPQSWEDVFKHPRFKELQKQAKEAQAALAAQQEAQAKAAEDELKEQAKWQQLYGDASRSTYEQNRRAAAATNGNQLERRILHAAESCADCIQYAALGWQPIGTLPRIGQSQCRTNCRCTFEYSTGP